MATLLNQIQARKNPERKPRFPSENALLGLASGLLESSGYSPVPQTFGTALGRGLQGYQRGRLLDEEQAQAQLAQEQSLAEQEQWQQLAQGLGLEGVPASALPGLVTKALETQLFPAREKPEKREIEKFGNPVDEIVNGVPVRVQYGTLGTRTVIEGTGPLLPPSRTGQLTQDERQSAFLLKRLEQAEKDIALATGTGLPAGQERTAEQRAAEKPGLFPSFVGLFSETARNITNPQQRQRVEAAQLDALDAALTLSTGAAYTKVQLEGLRRSYFPQIGDDSKTIADKKARLKGVIEAAKIRAGRAIQPEAPPLVPPPGAPGAFDLSPDEQAELEQLRSLYGR